MQQKANKHVFANIKGAKNQQIEVFRKPAHKFNNRQGRIHLRPG